MKKSVLRFPSSSMLIALLRLTSRLLSVFIGVNLWLLFVFSSTVHASPQPSNDVHFCLPLDTEDMRTRDSIYAATKHALNLNVGEPRTVRMIYFLPNDRPFRQEVVDSMKVTIRQIQTFYAEQMQAHGYGNKPFRFETDARGEPLVHRVDGQHPDSHYFDNTSRTVPDEIEQAFDLYVNIYLIVVDNSINAIGTGGGRRAGGTGGLPRKKMVDMGWFLEDLASTRRPMNWVMPLDCHTISGIMPTLCHMAVVKDTLYRRAMPIFWRCIPTLTAVLKHKRERRQRLNSFQRLAIR